MVQVLIATVSQSLAMCMTTVCMCVCARSLPLTCVCRYFCSVTLRKLRTPLRVLMVIISSSGILSFVPKSPLAGKSLSKPNLVCLGHRSVFTTWEIEFLMAYVTVAVQEA